MKIYSILLKLLLIFFLSVNLFAATKVVDTDRVNKVVKNDKGNVAYLGLQKNAPKKYKVTGNLNKDNKYNDKMDKANKIFITGKEQNGQNVNSANNTKLKSNKIKSKSKTKVYVYNITGTENKFNLTENEKRNIYDIDGREISSYSKKLVLTKYQKAQIDYLEMERKYKILAIEKELDLKKKMLDEELSKDFYDVYYVEDLSNEIKKLAVDKETVSINVAKKIRYVLDSDQYLKYKEQQKKNKN